jgi:hypothetical protein
VAVVVVITSIREMRLASKVRSRVVYIGPYFYFGSGQQMIFYNFAVYLSDIP